ncbi:hypothetical protein VW35_02220 [Devosia soli]|uniref:Sel1 repeat family protein n=2 Tax=Devosia soli TaxID=361041 RepID=A0A0F5LF76_9HYPH|nr:hypothetical protein VW35_02220 [Devosia soli]
MMLCISSGALAAANAQDAAVSTDSPPVQVEVVATRTVQELLEILRQGDAATGFEEARSELTELAESGDAVASVALGDLYRSGVFGEPDPASAKRFFEIGAKAGDGKALARLGELYRADTPLLPDEAKSLSYYTQSGDAGWGPALMYLGDYYTKARDAEGAIAAYEKAIAIGEKAAYVPLGDIFRLNRIHAPDYERADELFQQAADLGAEKGLTRLAQLRLDGHVGRVSEGVALLEKGILEDVPGAAVALADAYISGQGVKRSVQKGISILDAGVAKEDAASARRLIALYLDGAKPELQPNARRANAVFEASAGFLPDRAKTYEGAILQSALAADRTAFQSAYSQFTLLDQSQKASALPRIKRLNENSYVYLLQSALGERGVFQGTATGQLTGSTIRAVNAFCAENNLTVCVRGPLAGPVADALGKVL